MKALAARAPVVVLLGLALWLSTRGLGLALENRVPLAIVLGSGFWTLVGALGSAVAAGIAALALELRRARRSPLLASIRLLFVVLSAAWIVFVWRVHPFERLWLDLALGAAAGAWATLLLVAPGLAAIPRPHRRAVDALVFGAALAAPLLEVSLRCWSVMRPTTLLARVDRPPSEVLERNRLPPGTVVFGFPLNAGGHNDSAFFRKRPPERLAIAIGDSFSIGSVPRPLHFTSVCEERLGLPVYNMGAGGVGLPEYLHLLVEEALPLDPDVIVVDVFVGNDLSVWTRPLVDVHRGLRRWLERDHVLLHLVPRRLSRIARERRLRAAADGRVARVQGQDVAAAPGEIADLSRTFPWVEDPTLEQGTLSEEAYLRAETYHAQGTCDLDEAALSRVGELLLQMQAAAASIPLLVLIIPAEFQVEDEVWRRVEPRLSGEAHDRDRAQRLLAGWLRAQGIPHLDLLPVLRAVRPLADGRRHLYHLRDTHFNARGNRIVGEALAEFLRPFLR